MVAGAVLEVHDEDKWREIPIAQSEGISSSGYPGWLELSREGDERNEVGGENELRYHANMS